MSILKEEIEIGVAEAELATEKTLAEFPPLLRWFVIITAVAIIPAYFIAQGLSHGIWSNRYKQGQLEAKPSFTNPLDPKISNVYLTSLGTNNYAAAVSVTNQNLDLSVSVAPYQFTFSNAQKQTLSTYSGKIFLLPNETKYLVAPTFSTQDKIAYVDFTFTEDLKWQKKISITKIDIQTPTPKYYSQTTPPAFVVEGTFANNSPYKLKKVQLVFILTDFIGNIVGLSNREEFTIQPFEKRSYKQLWPNLRDDNIFGVKVFAQTDPLDQSNLTLPDYNTGDPGDLSRPSKTR